MHIAYDWYPVEFGMPMHLEVSMPRRIQISNWMQSCSITFMVVRSRIACKLHSITCFCDYLFVDELIVNLFAKSLWTSRGCILHCRLTVLKTGSNGLLSGLLIFIMTADERRRREYIVDTTTTTLVWRTFSTNHLLGRARYLSKSSCVSSCPWVKVLFC